MTTRSIIVLGVLLIAGIGATSAWQEKPTYRKDIEPIIRKHCLECHIADAENPSGLRMDTFEMIREGGENGDPIVPGKPDESLLYLKLLDPPPIGKRMPRNRESLSPGEIRTIEAWILKGAAGG